MDHKNSNEAATSFNLLLRVRYGECDAQQVVFNARYADYIDIALTEYFRALIGGFNILSDAGLDNQVVSLHIDWKSSAVFDDVLRVSVTPNKVGNTSFSFNISILQYKTNVVVATAVVTYVMVATDSFQKTSVPNWLRDKFLANSCVDTINHAGVV